MLFVYNIMALKLIIIIKLKDHNENAALSEKYVNHR
jgi:hypothetical protein